MVSAQQDAATPGPQSKLLERSVVYVAAGEAPDVLEAVDTPTARQLRLIEVDHLSQVEADHRPTVLILSRGLLSPDAPEVLRHMAAQVVVIATDSDAARLAKETGRCFFWSGDFSGRRGFVRGLKAALRQSASLPLT